MILTIPSLGKGSCIHVLTFGNEQLIQQLYVFLSASLQSLVISRVGADVYISRIERLRESKELNSAHPHIVKVGSVSIHGFLRKNSIKQFT